MNPIPSSESISPSQARATVHALSSKRDSPDSVERILIEKVSARIESIDERLAQERALQISTPAELESTRLKAKQFAEEQELVRDHEISEEQHRQELHAKKKDFDRGQNLLDSRATSEQRLLDSDTAHQIEANSRDIDLKYRRIEKELDIEMIGKLFQALNHSEKFYLSVNHPEIYAKIETAEAHSKSEMAQAIQQLVVASAEQKGQTEIMRDIMRKMSITNRRTTVSPITDETENSD